MKSLLKSGDTERIVYFANVCRQPEIYVMAANYLQSLEWRQDQDIMRNIINFYTRAKALVLLAGFYDSCAQVEIDEYQQYEKAGAALLESHKTLITAVNQGDTEARDRAAAIQNKLEKVRHFLQLRSLLDGDADEAIQGLYELLEDQNIEAAVRRGDIFAAIVEHYAKNKNFKSALGTLQEMKNRLPKVNPSYFVSEDALAAIGAATGATFSPTTRRGGGGSGEDDGSEEEEEEEEEVVEEEEEEEDRPMFNNRLMNGTAKFL
ncbi:hypothetical protein FHG87_023846 [Trinorchestia longiramus]|nr:hypothetical protein FHG87_023846 [Trinorchestia longiramus]